MRRLQHDTSEAAFPVTTGGAYAYGMTLRDYFAAQAIPAAMAATSGQSYKEIAIRSYLLADAMLYIREQEQGC